jgi:hypothetical protein
MLEQKTLEAKKRSENNTKNNQQHSIQTKISSFSLSIPPTRTLKRQSLLFLHSKSLDNPEKKDTIKPATPAPSRRRQKAVPFPTIPFLVMLHPSSSFFAAAAQIW